jgi:hypothetical protein
MNQAQDAYVAQLKMRAWCCALGSSAFIATGNMPALVKIVGSYNSGSRDQGQRSR